MIPDNKNSNPAHVPPFAPENRVNLQHENHSLSEAAGFPIRQAEGFLRFAVTENEWRSIEKNRDSADGAGKIFYRIG